VRLQRDADERNPSFLLRVISKFKKKLGRWVVCQNGTISHPPFREPFDLRKFLLKQEGNAARRREERVQVVAKLRPTLPRHPFDEVFSFQKSLFDTQEAR
jgi:hypothetical protein